MAIAKLAFNKFVESGAEELGKKLTDSATKKLVALGGAVWARIKGSKIAVKELGIAANEKLGETERTEAEQKLANYLTSLWNKDEAFAEQVKDLADELHFELTQIEDNSSMTQVNYGGTNYQNKISGGTVNQANTINIGKSND